MLSNNTSTFTEETSMTEQPERIKTVKRPAQQALNIHQRIREVKKEVSYVRKTGEVSQGRDRYKVVTHDEVTGVLHEPLVKHGVNMLINIDPSSILETQSGTSSSGTPRMRFFAVWIVDAISVDDPEDKITMTVPVHADDYSDKGPGKACSMAMKIAKLKIFDLETGENEEERVEDASGKGARKATPDEIAQLRALIAKSPTTEEKIIAYLRTDPTMRSLESLDELYFGVWEFCMKTVQGAINKNAES